MYPDSNIWVIGHSLGGALASLIGVTFGAPAVTFEAPGEKMAAGRLHVLLPVSTCTVSYCYLYSTLYSHLHNMSHMYITQRILFQWALVTVFFHPVPLVVTQWKAGSSHFRLISFLRSVSHRRIWYLL